MPGMRLHEQGLDARSSVCFLPLDSKQQSLLAQNHHGPLHARPGITRWAWAIMFRLPSMMLTGVRIEAVLL